MQHEQQRVIDQFMRTPAAQKILRDIEDKAAAERQAAQARIASLTAEREAAVESAQHEYAIAKRRHQDALDGINRLVAELTIAHNKLARAKTLHYRELEELRQRAEQLEASHVA